ncbi:anhydro-N-acetylmuramic acid kinase [Bacteroidota bacterium]
MQSYKAIGVMSGTSLDGLDIVLCNFSYLDTWKFNIEKSKTVEYSQGWKEELNNASKLNGLELLSLHKKFGRLIGESINTFLKNTDHEIVLIASHGHTVFHQPEKKLTLQIGDGYEIAALTRITTINDFRSMDVAFGGQGAPLVPIGDQLLFAEYDYCLNIGGFANISFEEKEERLAYDICPANIILNYLAHKLGQSYDKNGALGFLGKLNNELLQKLNSLEYYNKKHPKSLGKEWLENIFIPILEISEIPIHDKLRTIYEHIAQEVSTAMNIKSKSKTKTFITGGGVYNKLLINLIKQKTKFKEALIFAFLGVLRLKNQVNCLASVTGARKDCSSGVIYHP